MLKIFLVLVLLVASVQATTYSVVIDVPNLKANGKNWDILGGAPDILLKVDGHSEPIFDNCKNKYRCVMDFQSDTTDWYLEVYDKDKLANDIIGRGNCSVGQTCEFDGVKMKITE